MSIAPVYIIGKNFHADIPDELSWCAVAYSLTVDTFVLVCGRLGDVFGRRLMFIIGFAWFGLWSLLVGLSVWSNQAFFYCCRAFQGMGPAMLLPNAIAILGRAYPPGLRKEIIFSFFGATAPIHRWGCVLLYLRAIGVVPVGVLGPGHGLFCVFRVGSVGHSLHDVAPF
jgi:MFS family permease